MKSKYIFCGRHICSGHKLGYKLQATDKKKDDIYFSSRKSLYYRIGQIIEINMDKTGRFEHKALEEYINDDKIVKLELESDKQENDHKEYIAAKKAAKDKNIGKMTVAELIEWCKGNSTRKLLVQKFVENKLWRGK